MSHDELFEGYYNIDSTVTAGGGVASSAILTTTTSAAATPINATPSTSATTAVEEPTPAIRRCNSSTETASSSSNYSQAKAMKRSRSNISTSSHRNRSTSFNASNNNASSLAIVKQSKNFWEDSVGTFILNSSQPQQMHTVEAPESLYCGMPTVTDYGDDDDDDDDEEVQTVSADQKSGIFGACANLANSIVGGGIVGMPYAFKLCGFVSGLYLLIVTAILASTYHNA
jgi:hypothetical protein